MGRTAGAVAVLAIIVGACSQGSSATNQPVVACTSPDDCINQGPIETLVWCCLNKTCAYSGGALIVDCTDANAQIIQASKYDQSCKTDQDCVAVAEGNACEPGFRNCPTATINVGDMAKYNADVAMTNAALCSAPGTCLAESGPCCNGGACVMDCQRQPAPPCSDTAGCVSGQVCCLANEITMSTACQAAPCPDLPTRGPIQLCSTATECLSAGDVCVSLAIGQAKFCNAPDGGTEPGGVDGGTSDAPADG